MDVKLDAEQVNEILKTQAPPPGFKNFAVAMGAVASGQGVAFGTAMDPFKPTEVLRAPGSSFGIPPRCPTCHSLLQAIAQNATGDLLVECLFDGYEAVYRMGRGLWEPRPREGQTGPPGWLPPRFGETPEVSTPGPTAANPKPTRQPMARVAIPTEPPIHAEPPPMPGAVAQPDPVDEEGAEWLLLHDAAEITGKTAGDVYNLVRRKAVRTKRVKGRVLVLADDVVAAFKQEAAGG